MTKTPLYNINAAYETGNRSDKAANNNRYFNDFIHTCLCELKKYKQTICFNKEQLNEIKKIVDVEATYREWYYDVKLIGDISKINLRNAPKYI